MTLPTVAVSIAASMSSGAIPTSAVITFTLNGADIDAASGEIVVPDTTTHALNANGDAVVYLWPNARGNQGTQYLVVIEDPVENTRISKHITVPDSACDLVTLLNFSAAPPAQQIAQLVGASTATPTSSSTVLGETGGVVKRFAVSDLFPIYSVKMAPYNATGDGSTDDSAGINAASLAASTAGGTLYFPEGTYIGKNLRQYTNSKWIGAGRGSVLKLKASAGASDVFIINDNSGTNIDGSDAGLGNQHILMRDLQLDGNKANQTQAIPLVRWRRVQYGQITGCRLINSKGMAFDGCNAIDHCLISGNLLQNNEGVDISVRWVSNRCAIVHNVIIGANLSPTDGGESGSVTADAIHIKATNVSGAQNFNCAEFVVSGNVVKGKVVGLALEGVFDSVVSDSTFGGQTGSTITSTASATYICQGININGNVITQEASSSYYGLSLTGNRLNIQGNQITSTNAAPIHIPPGSNNRDITISGNTLKFTSAQDTSSAIYIRDVYGAVIQGNTIRNARNGVHLDTPSTGELMGSVSISQNLIYSSKRVPIRIDNGGASRNIKGVRIAGNVMTDWGSQAANTHDGIFIEQSGGAIEDIHIDGNTFYDASTNPRDAIRLAGTVAPVVIEPNQKVKGINGVMVTGYYSSAPASGAWPAGQRIHNFAPSAGGTEGWICTAAGTPGTWKMFGAIAA